MNLSQCCLVFSASVSYVIDDAAAAAAVVVGVGGKSWRIFVDGTFFCFKFLLVELITDKEAANEESEK